MKRANEPDVIANIKAIHPEAVCFMDDYIIYDVAGRPLPEYSSKINTYGFFLCLQGRAEVAIDLMPFILRPGTLMVNIPGQLITHKNVGNDLRGTCLVMTKHFIDSLALPYNFGMAIGIRETPVLELKPGELDALRNYCSMVRGLLHGERPYQAETLRHLTCAYAYSLGSYLYQMAEKRKLSGEESIMQRFMHEVRTHYKEERKVQFYAERLHLTAGYLSTLIKNISGKTASEWIDSYVLLEAKVLLKQTNMTVQQISDELNFPSQTFFGKYFKRLEGSSPKKFREG